MKSNDLKFIPALAGKLERFVKRGFRRASRDFLSRVSGVIHVGANAGQERDLYAHYNLNVVWVEPIPDVFARLKENIQDFPRQQAYQYLVTDEDRREYEFYIASNEGQSSSILDFNLHKEIWTDIDYKSSIVLKSIKLESLIEAEGIEIKKYDALIMDTQGTELLVLKGAESLLSRFKYIKTEAADFEVYKDCCQVKDIEEFVQKHGFKEISRKTFASRTDGGSCFDIVYKNLR